MSKLPEPHWTLDSAPAKATTLPMRRQWCKIANLVYRISQGDELEALRVANASLADRWWSGNDFLSDAWNRHLTIRHEVVDDVQDIMPANNSGLDPLQCAIAANQKARLVLADFGQFRTGASISQIAKPPAFTTWNTRIVSLFSRSGTAKIRAGT